METKPGSQTSEFKLTLAVVILGVALDGAGLVLGTLKDSGLALPWLPGALVVCGTLLTLVKALGYTRSRTMLKLAELQPQASEVLKAGVPLAQQVAALVKEELAKPAENSKPTPPSPSLPPA